MAHRFDPRLLIGVALVAASVIGMVALVAAVDRRTSAYAAVGALVPGQVLDASQLVERAVFLDGADDLYLRVGQLPLDELIVTRPVQAGELIPLASLGAGVGAQLTAVVVTPATELSSSIGPADTVELWMTEPAEGGVMVSPPRVLVADALVASIDDSLGLGSFASPPAVELLVPRSRLALILQAQADGAVLSVVPAGVPWDGS